MIQREGRWGQIVVNGKVLMQNYVLPTDHPK